MTVLTKPCLTIKKPDGTQLPLVDDDVEKSVCAEEKIVVYGAPPAYSPAKRSSGALLCMTVVALLVAATGFTCGLVLYRQYLRGSAVRRYQGFCSIPVDAKEAASLESVEQFSPSLELRSIPWSEQPFLIPGTTSDDLESLREKLEIGDMVESISVHENGRTTNFVHNFNDNVTAIMDDERCFITDLDKSSVLAPDLFLISIESGEPFDISRVRTTLRAVLPALQDLMSQASWLQDRCANKPTYRLHKELGIRKRSTDEPPHDFIQFAGKHVQMIQISNLGDVLQAEANRA